MQKYVTNSEEETKKLAEKLARSIKSNIIASKYFVIWSGFIWGICLIFIHNGCTFIIYSNK